MVMVIRLMSLALVLAVSASAQPTSSEQLDVDVASRISALSEHLRIPSADDDLEKSRKYAELDLWTARVHSEVDAYIKSALSAEEGSQRSVARLRRILAEHTPDSDAGDLPFAQVAHLNAGPALVVAFTLVRGAQHNVATIRGYHWNVTRYELVGKTGDDFEGHNMFEMALRSPVPGEFWLLAWGSSQTANGSGVRFRVYGFDGQTFRTVWSPEDMSNAVPHVTDSGIAIDHHVRYPPYEIHDEYALTVSGVIKKN
jgi:hypothetical protein